ncbi:MAG: YqeG family HAD IIIA-type phosphatase, partial [Oscillospiraceae bacterium]
MALFKPTKYIIKADEITPLWCNENNVKGIILDTDNTLSVHGSQMPADGILSWIDSLKKSGIKLVILSNNTKQRIEPFAKILDIPFVVNGAKPLKT